MKRALGPSTLLIFILVAASSGWAQASPGQPVPPQVQAPQSQPAQEGQDTAQTPAVPDPNMVPGHPLDPHDVDVLTGKLDRPSPPPTTIYVDSFGQTGYSYAYRRNRFYGPRLFEGQFPGRGFSGRGGRAFLPPRFFLHF